VTGPGQADCDSPEVTRLFELRSDPARDLARQAGAVAEACHAMAVRFHRGGRLIVFGTGGPSADAQHVAVEFVHPVIVGKRALPAISLTADGDNGSVLAGLATAKELGLLTIALVGGEGGRIAAAHVADHLLTAASDDPCVIKEMQVTTYHILWELVHVFFEQPGVLEPGVLA
jgi:D-sedoheptulose 7-phosphate isomerase